MTDLSKLTEFSTATIAKAEQLLARGAVERDHDYATIFWVKGSGGNRYRLQVVEPFDEDEVTGDTPEDAEALPYVTCTCPNGLNASGRPHCYHAAAVIGLILADEEADFGEDEA
jgi:hypothetical protein